MVVPPCSNRPPWVAEQPERKGKSENIAARIHIACTTPQLLCDALPLIDLLSPPQPALTASYRGAIRRPYPHHEHRHHQKNSSSEMSHRHFLLHLYKRESFLQGNRLTQPHSRYGLIIAGRRKRAGAAQPTHLSGRASCAKSVPRLTHIRSGSPGARKGFVAAGANATKAAQPIKSA